ncbi:hypothetical protein OQA88_3188 [Cercophora sp. LCS_1]
MEFLASKLESGYSKVRAAESESDDELLARPPQQRPGLVWRQRFYLLLTSFVSLGTGLLAGAAHQRHYTVCSSPAFSDGSHTVFAQDGPTQVIKPYSPAPQQYVNKFLMDDPDAHLFMGHPRPELDHAWHNLLKGTLVRLSAEELHAANYSTSIRHREGGYIGGIAVAHNLHCLKRIKQYFHPGYYPNELHLHEDQWEHIDHCLEVLRMAIMCHGDTNVYGLEWIAGDKYKPRTTLKQQNVCVDWAPLHQWMVDREATVDDMERPPNVIVEDQSAQRDHGKGLPHGHEGRDHKDAKDGEAHEDNGGY